MATFAFLGAGFGICLREEASDPALTTSIQILLATRPTNECIWLIWTVNAL